MGYVKWPVVGSPAAGLFSGLRADACVPILMGPRARLIEAEVLVKVVRLGARIGKGMTLLGFKPTLRHYTVSSEA